MTVELKEFGNAFFVKDKALKKVPDLKSLVVFTKALNKTAAETIAAGKLAEHCPANTDDYFKAKIWEHREGLPRIELGVFSDDFFDTIAAWNVNAGEPEFMPEIFTEPAGDDVTATEAKKQVRPLDLYPRAACLVLFGPVAEITNAQYGQVLDLLSDEGTFGRELVEAIAKERRVLELEPGTQNNLLAMARAKVKESAKWPDIQRVMVKWLDTPADKREIVTSASSSGEENTAVLRTDSVARLCTGVPTDRSYKHTKEGLGNEIAKGLLAREQEFNIYNSQPAIFQQAEKIRLSGTHEEFEAWYRIFITTPGGMDFSSAINIAVVKTSPPDLWKDPVKHREYFNCVMTESDHANPDPLIVDIACGRSSSPMPGAYLKEPKTDETQSTIQNETELPAVCPGRAAQLDKELNDAFEMREPAPLTDREIEIAHALNDLLSGRTRQLSVNEVEDSIALYELSISDLVFLLMEDVAATEYLLSPNLDDHEVQLIAAVILDAWSDDLNIRQQVMLDAIVEYRKPAPAPVCTVQPCSDEEVEKISAPAMTTLTYRQQLTIAALQGLCANPAYCNSSEEIPKIADWLATGLSQMLDGDDE